MRVTVNPERDAALLDQRIQVGSEGRLEWTVCVIRSFRAIARCMMRHNDGARAVALGQRSAQPSDGLRVQPCGVARAKHATFGTERDDAVVAHDSLGCLHCAFWIGRQLQVRQYSTSQQSMNADLDSTGLKYMD